MLLACLILFLSSTLCPAAFFLASELCAIKAFSLRKECFANQPKALTLLSCLLCWFACVVTLRASAKRVRAGRSQSTSFARGDERKKRLFIALADNVHTGRKSHGNVAWRTQLSLSYRS